MNTMNENNEMIFEKSFEIYKLVDPRDNETRYVGATTIGRNARLAAHISAAKHGRKALVAQWIRELLEIGKKPLYIQLETGVGSHEDCEKFWINFYNNNSQLTNQTIGGAGVTGYNHTAENCKKISDSMIGIKRTEETKLKISESRMKKVICLETGKIYSSQKELAKLLGVNVQNIHIAIKNNKSHKGFYYSKFNEQQEICYH